jgi:phospholipid-translocating ATPase
MNLKVGQIVKVHQNERLPADLILLYTTEKTGSVFIRTD